MILAGKKYQTTLTFMIFARKITKIPEFYIIFARKMPEFFIIIAGKIFFPNFRGARPPLLRLWKWCIRFLHARCPSCHQTKCQNTEGSRKEI